MIYAPRPGRLPSHPPPGPDRRWGPSPDASGALPQGAHLGERCCSEVNCVNNRPAAPREDKHVLPPSAPAAVSGGYTCAVPRGTGPDRGESGQSRPAGAMTWVCRCWLHRKGQCMQNGQRKWNVKLVPVTKTEYSINILRVNRRD